jgi:5-enolpyruvylshikimate-3-phosphate synthase
VLGAVASGKTTVFNAEHVRHKETDRLHAMAQELSKMGADIRQRPDGPVRARAESCMELTDMARSAGSSWR